MRAPSGSSFRSYWQDAGSCEHRSATGLSEYWRGLVNVIGDEVRYVVSWCRMDPRHFS